jgi:hypothetical protein
MAKKCKYAKRGKPVIYVPYDICYCTSPSNHNCSKGNQYKRSNGEGYPITGYSDGTRWWDLCMEGKADNGVTPSKCDYYK